MADPAPERHLPSPEEVLDTFPAGTSLWEMALSGSHAGLGDVPAIHRPPRRRSPWWLTTAVVVMAGGFVFGFVALATAGRVTPGSRPVAPAASGAQTGGGAGVAPSPGRSGGSGTGHGTSVVPGATSTPGGQLGGGGLPGSGSTIASGAPCIASMLDTTPADGSGDEVVVSAAPAGASVTARIEYGQGPTSYTVQADVTGRAYVPITLGSPPAGQRVTVVVSPVGGQPCQTSFTPQAAPAG